jgi:soluble lytic murein transglycosylase-like protein
MPNLGAKARGSGWGLIRICVSLTTLTLAWLGVSTSYLPPDSQREEPTAPWTVEAVVERIIDVESGGDPNAKNKRSSATGLGQFLDETWLDMIRAHRPIWPRGAAKTKS